jgi:hypothetical protein
MALCEHVSWGFQAGEVSALRPRGPLSTISGWIATNDSDISWQRFVGIHETGRTRSLEPSMIGV